MLASEESRATTLFLASLLCVFHITVKFMLFFFLAVAKRYLKKLKGTE